MIPTQPTTFLISVKITMMIHDGLLCTNTAHCTTVRDYIPVIMMDNSKMLRQYIRWCIMYLLHLKTSFIVNSPRY